MGQIFINDGTKFNSQFQINNVSSNIDLISITALKNNNFVVTWDNNNNITGQILTDNGNKVGLPFVNTGGDFASITSLANGNFVVAYTCNNNICAKIFHIDGTTLKSQFIVNTYIHVDRLTSISSISNSNFMIVWASSGQDIFGSSDWGVYAQSFTSSGVKIGNEFRVNTYILGNQGNPSIASLSNDNYIVKWDSSNNQDGSETGVYAQILDSSGNKIGNEFGINTFTYSSQQNPSVSSLINTNFVIVWTSHYQDSTGWGIFGDIYQNNGSVVGFDTCPLNCQSCDYNANCLTCNPNFQLQQSGLCACIDGFYLDNMFSYLCISNFIFLN